MEVFGSNDNSYNFEDFGLIVPINSSENATNSKIYFSFSLKYDRKSVNIPQLELPEKTKQTESAKNRINPDDRVLSMSSLSESHGVTAIRQKRQQMIKELQETNRQSEIKSIPDDSSVFHDKADSARGIPRTFSYNLTITDGDFNRRPHPGIWQFR